MSNWWASKLGNAPAPAQRPQSTPPTYATPPIRIAREVVPPPAYSQPTHVLTRQEPPQEPPVDANGQVHIIDAVRRWKGTKDAQAIDSCPSCGSPHVFAIRRGGVNGNSPAPRCTACGWNGGLFEQGEQANWV